MAWMNQERKAGLAPAIKAALKKYGLKGSLSVNNHSTLVLTITEGQIDFIGNSNRVCGNDFYQTARGFKPNDRQYDTVNEYWYHDHYDGLAKIALSEIIPLMNIGNHDRSDIQTDYFDVGWYTNIHIGRWNKPYKLTFHPDSWYEQDFAAETV